MCFVYIKGIGKTSSRWASRASHHVVKSVRTETMTLEIGARKGRNWLKIIGIITLIGLVVAVARIILRVFREKPYANDEVSGV